MNPFFSSASSYSAKGFLLTTLLLCPGVVMASVITPISTDVAIEHLAGMGGDHWCLLYQEQGFLQILDGTACDRPQVGLVRHFD